MSAHIRISAITLLASLAIAPSVVEAHSLTTKTGHAVAHNHWTSCQYGCISDDAFEAQYGISRADRVYAGTWSWNCHGRTFDGRQSWVNYADPWITWDGPVCPLYPAQGDTAIWFNSSFQTTHSVTLTGPWNNQSTIMMSKYGAQGQYRHALSKSVLVYGTNWSVTRFTAGTAIYWNSLEGPDGVLVPSGASEQEIGAQLLASREQTPWFETVMASEVFYDVERPRLVARIGGLSDSTRARIEAASTVTEQIDALAEDFGATDHYTALSAYVSPVDSEDIIAGVEAGNVLVKLAQRRPAFRDAVIQRLSSAFDKAQGDQADRLRGASLHFLTPLLTADERTAFVSRVKALDFGTAAVDSPTYTEYYLGKMEAAR